ncbi:MAG: TIGR02147 family protein [Sandaracinaceae bacterium]
MTTRVPSVFEYLDYRAFLADYYVAKKDEGRGFSFRAFSRRAGLKSPSHLKLVIDGERALTPTTAARYAKAMRLDDEESSYFLDLVGFNQARTASERIEAYQALTGHQGYRKAQKLDASHADYYSRWYIPAIREMAMQESFESDPAWIASRMVPAISEEQAAEALAVLLELELLTKLEDGTLAPTEWLVQTPDATRGVHLARYHRAMLERASESIDLVPSNERYLAGVTLCVGENGLAKIVERIQRLRQELISLATLEEEGQQVVHVGLQVFPLTRGADGAR